MHHGVCRLLTIIVIMECVIVNYRHHLGVYEVVNYSSHRRVYVIVNYVVVIMECTYVRLLTMYSV